MAEEKLSQVSMATAAAGRGVEGQGSQMEGGLPAKVAMGSGQWDGMSGIRGRLGGGPGP